MHKTICNYSTHMGKLLCWMLIIIFCCFVEELEGQTTIYSVPYNSDVLLQKTDLATGISDTLETYMPISLIRGINETSNTLYFVKNNFEHYKLRLTEGSTPELVEIPLHAKYEYANWIFYEDDRKFYYQSNGDIYRFSTSDTVVERISLPNNNFVYKLVKGNSQLIYASINQSSITIYKLNLQTLVLSQQFIIDNLAYISSIEYDSFRQHYYCFIDNKLAKIYDKNGTLIGEWTGTGFSDFKYEWTSDKFYWREGNQYYSSNPLQFQPELYAEIPQSYSSRYLHSQSKFVCTAGGKRVQILNVYLDGQKTDSLMYNSLGKITQIVPNESENCLYLIEKFEGQVLRYDLNTHEHTPIFSHDGIIESIAHDKINNRIFVTSPISYSESRLFEIDLTDLSFKEPLDSVPDLIKINYEANLNQIYGLTKYDSGFFYSHYIVRINLNTGSIQHINGSGGGDSQGYLLDISNQYFYNLKFFGNEVIRMKYNLILGGTIMDYPPEPFNSIEWLDSSKIILALGGSGQLYSWNVETNAIDSLFKFDSQIEHFSVSRMEPNSSLDQPNSSIHDCRAFPNPSQDFIYLDCEVENHPFQIIDINGKIQTQSLNPENSPQIDISQLVPGFYFVRYIINKEIINIPFIKS